MKLSNLAISVPPPAAAPRRRVQENTISSHQQLTADISNVAMGTTWLFPTATGLRVSFAGRKGVGFCSSCSSHGPDYEACGSGCRAANARDAALCLQAGPRALYLQSMFTTSNLLVPGRCVQVDGSILEGGGQVVRIATCLSALLGGGINIDKIRAGRSKPGLAGDNSFKISSTMMNLMIFLLQHNMLQDYI